MTESKLIDMKNPLAHYIPLWIIAVFSLAAVCVCTLGGYQEGLIRREIPETKVNGDLTVTGTTEVSGDLIHFPSLGSVVSLDQDAPSFSETVFPDVGTAQILVAAGDGITTFTINLPRPTSLDIGKKFVFIFEQPSRFGSIVFNVGAANNDLPEDTTTVFAPGSNMGPQSNDNSSPVLRLDQEFNRGTLTVGQNTNFIGGRFTKYILTAVAEGQYFLEPDFAIAQTITVAVLVLGNSVFTSV